MNAGRPSAGRLLLLAVGLALALSAVLLLLRPESVGPDPTTEPASLSVDPSPARTPGAVEQPAVFQSELVSPEVAPLVAIATPEASGTERAPVAGAARGSSLAFHVNVVAQDASAGAVAGARVEVWPSPAAAGATPYDLHERSGIWDGQGNDPRPSVQPPTSTAATDEQGRCALLLPSYDAVFLVTRYDIGTSGLWYAKAVGSPVEETTTVVLRPPGHVVGRVVRSDDRPVAGAVVRFTDSMGSKDWSDKGSGRGDPRCPLDVVTGADGTFDVKADASFMGLAQAFLESSKSSVEMAHWTASARSPLILRFAGRFGLHGVVTNEAGEPLAGAEIKVTRILAQTVETVAADDGQYAIDLFEPGRYALAAELTERPELIMAEPSFISLSEQLPQVAHDIVFIRAAEIAGHARWIDGSPVDVLVRAEPIESRERPLSQLQGFALKAFTPSSEVDGRFRLRPVHPGFHYRVECKVQYPADLLLQVDDVAPGTEDLEFVFDPAWRDGTTISGTVVDARTHAPLQSFSAELLLYWDESREVSALRLQGLPAAKLEASGRFSFSHVPFGKRYFLEVSADGYATTTVGPLDPRERDPDLAVTLRELGSLQVQVVSEDGSPVAGAYVGCLVPDAEPIAIPHFERIHRAVTSDSGTVTFEALVPGTYGLQACTLDASSRPESATVGLGGTTSLTLTLDSASGEAGLMVHVVDRFGAAVPGTELWVTCPTPGPVVAPAVHAFGKWTTRTDSNGNARFDALPSGLFTAYCNDLDRGIATPQVFVLSAGTCPSIELCLK